MSLFKFHHVVKEINGINVRIIESNITNERALFLQKLLTLNNLETVIEEVPSKVEGQPSTFLIATPDLTFNLVVKVYNRELRTESGNRVTPDYWNQLTTTLEPNYYDRDKKDFPIQ